MISIMIPAFNEEIYLEKTVDNIINASKNIENLEFEIIIMNDGSTDGTKEIALALEKRYPFIRSIHHDTNQGFGRVLKDAVQIAAYPKFMIVPGDNDFSNELIEKIFQNRDKADLLFIYYLNREHRGRRRNVLSMLFGLIYMAVYNVFVEYINGAILYPTEKLRQLDIKSRRFSIIAELAVKLLCSGCTFHEIPGYMQTGLEGSSSLSLKSLYEAGITFIKVAYEIKFQKRSFFNKKPIRIF